jgi:hypothetical protein
METKRDSLELWSRDLELLADIIAIRICIRGSGCSTWRKLENTAYRPNLWAEFERGLRKQRAWIFQARFKLDWPMDEWIRRKFVFILRLAGTRKRFLYLSTETRRYDHLPIHRRTKRNEDHSAE